VLIADLSWWALLESNYTDHLTPMVRLALQTGLRFGELAGLRCELQKRLRAQQLAHGVEINSR
jgi:hypothetical protein